MKYIWILFLSSICAAQVVTLGPLSTPAIDPTSCTTAANQTSVCFASDGVHVSIVGAPYGGALCDSTNPACRGPQGSPGVQGPQGVQGSQGTTGATGPAGGTGPQGPPGQDGPSGATGPSGPQGAVGPAGPQGSQGPPGVIKGSVLTGTITCQPQSGGSIPKGFTSACTFTITSIQ